MRHERRALLLGILLALLLARSLRALLSTAFYESLVTLRLNESAGWTIVLLAPLLAPLAGRRGLRVALGVAGLASSALPLARLTAWYLPTSALATGAGLLALGLLLRREGAMAGVVVGMALEAALLMVGDSHDPTLARWSIPFGLLATALAVVLSLRASEPAPTPPRGWLAGAALAALFAVELAFLASPFAVARWMQAPAWATGLCALGGLAAGAALVRRAPWPLWVLAGLALLDVTLFLSPLRLLSLALLQIGMGAAAVRLAPRARAEALGAVFGPLVFVLLFFRDPLGLAEWRALVPLLALAALFPAARALATTSGRAPVAAPILVVVLALLSALPAPIADAPEGRELALVTWNVHQGFGNRGALDPHIYADVLRRLDADVVLLQESDTARLSSGGLDIVRFLADELGMHAAYARVGPAILSRYPFVTPTREAPEWSLETAIEVDGTRIALQSVHFARNPQERALQAQAIVDAPPGPRIVAGDFNLFGGLVGGPYETLTTRYQDAWVAAGHERDDTDGHTFTTQNLRRRIDIVFVDGIEVVAADRVLDEGTRLGSDHLPVLARLRVPEP